MAQQVIMRQGIVAVPKIVLPAVAVLSESDYPSLCHAERSEGPMHSLFVAESSSQEVTQVLRCAQDDNMNKTPTNNSLRAERLMHRSSCCRR